MNLKSLHRAILIGMLVFPTASFAGFGVGIGINVSFAPPPLPLYAQPACPAPGYIWTPGYWGYDENDQDYYWVPGTWVVAPSPGLLWTPGYWGLAGGSYAWNDGYWGAQVGFYGGIDYGYGYSGEGFEGGYWRGGDFFYNRSVTNVTNVNITNIYNRSVRNNFSPNRASFNGINGVPVAPTHGDLLAARLPHYGPTAPQRMQADSALTLPSSRASMNHGRPPLAATQRPGASYGVPAANVVQGSNAPAFGGRAQSAQTAEQRPFTSRQYESPLARSASGQIAENRFYHPSSVATQSSGHRAPSGFNSYQRPPNQTGDNFQAYETQRSYPAPRNTPVYRAPVNNQAEHSPQPYQAPHSYQAPRNTPVYRAPASNQAARSPQAYQAPRSYGAPRMDQTREAPVRFQTARSLQPYQATPRDDQAPRKYQVSQASVNQHVAHK